MSGSSIGGIGNDKERQRRDKPSRKASCRVEWGEVQQDLLGERQKQVEACRRMAERMSEQDAREGQEESRVLIDTDTVSLCGLKIDNNCPQALIRPRARSDDPGRRELPEPQINLGKSCVSCHLDDHRTFPTFIVCLLLPPVPPYQTLFSHLYIVLVLCLWLLTVRLDSSAYCSSRQSLLVLLGFFRAANSMRWAIASPQVEASPFAKGSSAVKRPNSISADLSCSSLALFLIAPTFDLLPLLNAAFRRRYIGLGDTGVALASPFLTPAVLDRSSIATGVGILTLLFAGQSWRALEPPARLTQHLCFLPMAVRDASELVPLSVNAFCFLSDRSDCHAPGLLCI